MSGLVTPAEGSPHLLFPNINISSRKELEREWARLTRILNAKESDLNWEDHEKSLHSIRGLLRSDSVLAWPDAVLQGIQGMMDSIVKSIHSLRTTLSLEALHLVSDIGSCMGSQLDVYSFEILLHNLLRCSSVTKKVIATRAKETTIVLLSNAAFYGKVVHMLASQMDEKNSQARHFAAIYMNVLLRTHGPRRSTRVAIERSSGLDEVESFLKRGLLDASPFVREACRQVFWSCRAYWPHRTENVVRILDTVSRRQLERARPIGDEALDAADDQSQTSMPRTSTASMQSRLSVSSSVRSDTPSLSSRASTCSSTISTLSRASSYSRSSARNLLTKSSSLRSTPVTLPMRRPRSAESKQIAAQASVALFMRLLQSTDASSICHGVRKLAAKMRGHDHDPLVECVLPIDVPPRTDLVPLFTKYLYTKQSTALYDELMSWPSLTTIFTHVLTLEQYVPTLVLAQAFCSCRGTRVDPTPARTKAYQKGFGRLKLILKRKNPHLIAQLLDIYDASIFDRALADEGARRHLTESLACRDALQRGLLQWIDELALGYLGDPTIDDPSLLVEGSSWIVGYRHDIAYRWFDQPEYLQRCLKSVLQSFRYLAAGSDTFNMAKQVALQLRMIDRHAFEKSLHKEPAATLPASLLVSDAPDQESVSVYRALTDVPDLWLEEGLSTTKDDAVWDPVDVPISGEGTGMTTDLAKMMLTHMSPPTQADSSPPAEPTDTNPPSITGPKRRSSPEASTLGDVPALMEDSVKRLRAGQPMDLTVDPAHVYDYISQLNLLDAVDSDVFPCLWALVTALPEPSHTSDNTGDERWTALMDALVSFLQRCSSGEGHIEALKVMKPLLAARVVDITPHFMRLFCRELLARRTRLFSTLATVAGDVFKTLMQTCPPLIGIDTVMELLREELQDDVSSAARDETAFHPTSALFMHLAEMIPRTPSDVLEQCLATGASDLLLEGFNHQDVSVRKSCVHTMVSLHRVLGDDFLKTHLSSLRSDQLGLVYHYIAKAPPS